tara:strand:- start:53 stop:388 length:336 start_codon:yes stop_codon:yes gene_type:complete
MIPLSKMNKNLVTYSLVFLIVVPIFGFNFLISFIGNILILIFLVPLLILLIAFISLNSFKSKIKTCNQCGSISLGINNKCTNCGADLDNEDTKNFENPSETTIEIKAEEVN